MHAVDDKATIVKHAECIVRNKENFAFLSEESLTNISQLPNNLTKTQQYFYRGKPISTGEPICTNIRTSHTADIQEIIGDLKYDLEVESINLGLQRLQHHDVATIGYICSMLELIDTHEWTKILKNALKKHMQYEPELSLKSSKFLTVISMQEKNLFNLHNFACCLVPLPKMGVHIETIGSQNDLVRRALTSILPKLDKHLYGVESRFIPALNC